MKRLNKIVLAALFLAAGIVIPFLTAQIKEIGDSLLPMHIPVLLCGFICGWQYGALVGFVLPIIRGAAFGMPPLYPNAIWMTFELLTYGFAAGFLYLKRKKDSMLSIYLCLIGAMVLGRIVWAIVKIIVLGLSGTAFTFGMFITGGILDAIPGIILQLVLIPAIVRIIGNRR